MENVTFYSGNGHGQTQVHHVIMSMRTDFDINLILIRFPPRLLTGINKGGFRAARIKFDQSWQTIGSKAMWKTRTDWNKENIACGFWFLLLLFDQFHFVRSFPVCGIIVIKWSKTSRREEEKKIHTKKETENERNSHRSTYVSFDLKKTLTTITQFYYIFDCFAWLTTPKPKRAYISKITLLLHGMC